MQRIDKLLFLFTPSWLPVFYILGIFVIMETCTGFPLIPSWVCIWSGAFGAAMEPQGPTSRVRRHPQLPSTIFDGHIYIVFASINYLVRVDEPCLQLRGKDNKVWWRKIRVIPTKGIPRKAQETP